MMLRPMGALALLRDASLRSLCRFIRLERHDANDILYWYVLVWISTLPKKSIAFETIARLFIRRRWLIDFKRRNLHDIGMLWMIFIRKDCFGRSPLQRLCSETCWFSLQRNISFVRQIYTSDFDQIPRRGTHSAGPFRNVGDGRQ